MDALDSMPPNDAYEMDNFFPDIGSVSMRKGYQSHATGVAGQVKTLATYQSGANNDLIACGGGSIYDASNSGAMSSLGSGFASDVWSTVNFNGLLMLVNGSDTPQQWDGTTLSAMSWTGTGLTVSNLTWVYAFKNRLYFGTGDQDFWYAGLNSITGTLTKFELSRVSEFGGNLIAMTSWTVDAGIGIDDHAVFIFSSGQIALYAGTDPSSASDWSLVGIYNIGAPIDARGIVRIGGDIRITTQYDYISLREVFSRGELGTPTKASGALTTAANSNLFGWQSILFPEGSFALFNVPISASQFQQHVVNTRTFAWCRFTGVNANCWETYDNKLYFGGTDNNVYEFWSGFNDNGSNIQATSSQAWSDLGSPGRKKITAKRPVIGVDGDVTFSMALGYDFRSTQEASSSAIESNETQWDVSAWDVSSWSDINKINTSWAGAIGTGVSVSPKLTVSARQAVKWQRTDLKAEILQGF